MSQVIWIVDTHLKLSIYDYASGVLLKSYPSLTALHARPDAVQGHGLYGDWLWMQDRAWIYFWHHSLLAVGMNMNQEESRKPGGTGTGNGTGPWFKLSRKESGSEGFASALLSHNGQYFIYTLQHSDKIAIYSMSQGTLVRSFQTQAAFGPVHYLGLSEDDQLLVALNHEGQYQAWHLYDTFFQSSTLHPLNSDSNPSHSCPEPRYMRRLASEPNKQPSLSASVCLTRGTSQQARMLVACENRVYLLRLWTGEHLATFLLPTRISLLRMNALESEFYCVSIESNPSSSSSTIYSLSLNTMTSSNAASMTTHHGCQQFHIENESTLLTTPTPTPMNSHSHIVGLESSLTGDCLVSLSSQGLLHYWDLKSRTRLKSIQVASSALYLRLSLLPPFLTRLPLVTTSSLYPSYYEGWRRETLSSPSTPTISSSSTNSVYLVHTNVLDRLWPIQSSSSSSNDADADETPYRRLQKAFEALQASHQLLLYSTFLNTFSSSSS